MLRHLNVIKNQSVNKVNNSRIKKTRLTIIFLVTLIVFFGAQNSPTTNSGETQSFFEALMMTLTIFFVQYMFSSDYMFNSLRKSGLNINYSLFQKITLLVIILMLYIVSSAYLGI